ncbi:zinc finger HIT domain-containing protein 2 [Belonocnema kinseyi]|uniref:zinc finger HIT domain-containing protein 2 n=1 Tax=Belonocnema kinseyi TaxID=2817044 RepID=UPI00143D4B91|nr:zinc finger HIT domain-containing protein 2 [Belonocnema kinseyi]
MDDSCPSKVDTTYFCRICDEKPRQYTCPQCGINYCSLKCYQSEGHQDCSESFYKDWVELEMQVRDYDPENKKKMLEIFERLKQQAEEPSIMEDIFNDRREEDPEQLDSDDEEDGPSLEERLANIDLDNADVLWSALTNAERQEFETLLQSNEIDQMVPQWKPWWEQTVEKKLVREVDEIPEYQHLCPALVVPPKIIGQMKSSTYVQFNMMNVIYSYAYTAVHFSGDHLNSAKLATQVFLYVCDNMSQKKVFTDAESAARAVFQRIFGESNLMESKANGRMLSVKQAGDQIMRGPEKANCCYYVIAALSDLHRLVSKAKVDLNCKSEPAKTQFPRKFQEHKDLERIDVSKKNIELHLKKLEFYLSWINLYGKKLCGTKLH